MSVRIIWVAMTLGCLGAFAQSHWKWERIQLACEVKHKARLNAVAVGENRLVAVGDYGNIFVSRDGAQWSSHPVEGHHHLVSATWTGSRFVAVGYNDGSGASILTSEDGRSWLLRKSPVKTALSAVSWTEAGLVAVGAKGVILTSVDGEKWALVRSGTTEDLNAGTRNGKSIIVVGAAGTAFVSKDSAHNWNPLSMRTDDDLQSVAVGGGTHVATGWFGFLGVSRDGREWTSAQLGENINLNFVVWTGRQFFIVGHDDTPINGDYHGRSIALSSLNGEAWSEEYLGTQGVLREAAWTGRQLLAVDAGSCLLLAGMPDDP